VLAQKRPVDVVTHFQSVAEATANSVTTNIPQTLLPTLLTLADAHRPLHLQAISFDPNLPDPHAPNGKFNPAEPDIPYMRRLVSAAVSATPNPSPTPAPQPGQQATTTGMTAPTIAPACTSGRRPELLRRVRRGRWPRSARMPPVSRPAGRCSSRGAVLGSRSFCLQWMIADIGGATASSFRPQGPVSRDVGGRRRPRRRGRGGALVDRPSMSEDRTVPAHDGGVGRKHHPGRRRAANEAGRTPSTATRS
jgi:hypothetical protein